MRASATRGNFASRLVHQAFRGVSQEGPVRTPREVTDFATSQLAAVAAEILALRPGVLTSASAS